MPRRLVETFEALDNIKYVRGKHNLKMGFLMRRNRGDISTCCDSDFGLLNFDGFATGFDYADFLLGLPQSTTPFRRASARPQRRASVRCSDPCEPHILNNGTLLSSMNSAFAGGARYLSRIQDHPNSLHCKFESARS